MGSFLAPSQEMHRITSLMLESIGDILCYNKTRVLDYVIWVSYVAWARRFRRNTGDTSSEERKNQWWTGMAPK